MAKVLETYPIVDNDIIYNINPEISKLRVYSSSNMENEIQITKDSEKENSYYIDDNGGWSPATNDFVCSGSLILTSLNCLYNENQIADTNTTLGVAVTVTSKTSKLNNTYPIGEFNYGNDNISLPFNFKIEKQRLSEKIELDFFLYVKEVEKESLFASVVGSNLGSILLLNFDIEGSGSIFPITIIDDSTKPLWTMSLNYDDYTQDFSTQTVCIKLNKGHRDFQYLGSEDITPTNYYLWKEILGSFFLTILLNSKEDFESLYNNIYEDGTVGCFISYLITVFNIDKPLLENPIELSSRIRFMLDVVIK